MKWNEIVVEGETAPRFVSGQEHDTLVAAGYKVSASDIDHIEYSHNSDHSKVIDISNRGIRTPGQAGPITRSLFGTVEKAIAFLNGEREQSEWTAFDGSKMTEQDLSEGAELYCPNCNDYMGKPSENDENATCSNCGEKFFNNGGAKRSKGTDEKFGRLSLTNVEIEDGTTQARLQTSKGQPLGSLIQYGRQWDEFDNGNWEAYCMAIKKRKKGFPDKKKAVDWIVRQTRATMKSNASVTEATTNSGLDQIPSWDGLGMSTTAPVAEYQKRTRFADQPLRAWVYQQKGRFMVVQGENEMTFKTVDKLDAWLTANGFIDHMGTTQVNL